MYSRNIAFVVSTALALGATQALAGTVVIPNSFASGTTISSSEMNANFSAIGTGVNGNATDIGVNAGNITTNTGNITTNATGIATNAGNITTNATGIATNAAAITALQSAAACAGNDAGDEMVAVGPFCVDKYEASVWSTVSGGTQYGASSDDYPCADKAGDCTTAGTPIYARSQSGVTPSSRITWFQAQMACVNAGKRLLTNAEWQAAVMGTADPGADDGSTGNCNTTGAAARATGGGTSCASAFGAEDMVGNLAEWIADWMAGTGATADGTGPYDGDMAAGYTEAVSSPADDLPGALYRGGDFGDGTAAGVYAIGANISPASGTFANVGFRCAK